MKNTHLLLVLNVCLYVFWLLTGWTNFVVYVETFALLYIVIDKLCKGLLLRETIALHTTFITLVVPEIGYRWYTFDNPLARVWVKYMPVPAEDYFSYTIPCVLLFNSVLCLPNFKRDTNDEGLFFKERFQQVVEWLDRYSFDARPLIIFGVISFILVPYLPGFLQFIFFLCFLLSFTGAIILYHRVNVSYRNLYLLLFAIFLFANSLNTGMFTILVYMGLTLFSFLFLGFQLSFQRKLILFVGIAFLIVLLQNVKALYRSVIWSDTQVSESKALLFGKILASQAQRTDDVFSPESFFNFYTRTNQGLNIAYVMEQYPARKEFDYGNRLVTVAISAFVPRLLWEDKPMAGGRFNMEYYAGKVITGGTSMNVGPIGEAYGSFGRTGGVIYIGLLAYFMRYVYFAVFRLWNKYPLLIFFIPVLFFQTTYAMETDTLQILNSIIKGVVFLFVMYMITPQYFRFKR